MRRTVIDPGALPDPVPISARLLELFGPIDHDRPSVLELGCGTGATSIRLALRGARTVTGIDLSTASVELARKRIAGAELDENQVRFEVADAATADLQPHDWVVLDRVICCYRYAEGLLANAIPAAGSRLAFSIPESRGARGMLNVTGRGVKNLWKTATRRHTCLSYTHDLEAIDRILTTAGFQKLRESHHRLWYAAIYDRATPTHPREPRPGANQPNLT